MSESLKTQFTSMPLGEKILTRAVTALVTVPLTAYGWYRKIVDPPRTEFTSTLGTIKLPETWTDKPHRLAFDSVGRYVTDALSRHEMLAYIDSHLQAPNSLKRINEVSLGVWHETLELFADAGWILRRWRFVLEAPYTHIPGTRHFTPQHDQHGQPLPRPEKDPLHGLILKQGERNLRFLTNAERDELMGKSYPLYSNDRVRTEEHPDRKEQIYVVVGPDNFKRIYYRPLEILDGVNKDRANKFLTELWKAKAFKGQ